MGFMIFLAILMYIMSLILGGAAFWEMDRPGGVLVDLTVTLTFFSSMMLAAVATIGLMIGHRLPKPKIPNT